MASQSADKTPGLAPPGSDHAIRNALAALETKLGELRSAMAHEEAALTHALDVQMNGGYEPAEVEGGHGTDDVTWTARSGDGE